MKTKILIICTINKMRSRTAEEILKVNPNYEVRSAGTSPKAAIPISEEIIKWADIIFVMEKCHRNFIHKRFPEIYKSKKIECLYIPDEYDYMDPELINILNDKLKRYLQKEGKMERN